MGFYFLHSLLFPSQISNRDPVSSAHVPRFTFRELAGGWDWGGIFLLGKVWGGTKVGMEDRKEDLGKEEGGEGSV